MKGLSWNTVLPYTYGKLVIHGNKKHIDKIITGNRTRAQTYIQINFNPDRFWHRSPLGNPANPVWQES